MSEEEKKAIEKIKWYFEKSPTLDITKNVNIVLNLIEKQQKEIEKSYKVKFKVGEKARLRDGLTIGCMGNNHNKEVIIKRIIISDNHISYYVDYIKDGEKHSFMVGLEDSDLIKL